MLKSNGSHIQNRLFTQAAGVDYSSTTLYPLGRLMGNRLAFGKDASWPFGYHSDSAVLLSFRTNGFVTAILRGDSSFTANLTALGNLTSNLAGSSTIVADANAAANLYSTLLGEGTMTAQPSAKGNMSGTINAGATPSAYDIAQEVWGSIAAQNNVPATMGNKLNSAGGAANPWDVVIESGLTAGEVLKLILAVQAGESTVVALGGGLATVTFKSVDGQTSRVTAHMDGSERTSMTLVP
jgi:hypothetical protein